MTKIQRAALALIKRHGGVRPAARLYPGVLDAGYLCRLAKGRHTNPGPQIMAILGVERQVTYRRIRTGSGL